jgi:hypothetical protein
MTDLAEILDIALSSPIERAEAVLRLVPSPAPVEPPAAEPPHDTEPIKPPAFTPRQDAEAGATAKQQDAAAIAEVEYAPMYYI